MSNFNICISGSRYANDDHIDIIKDTIFNFIVSCKDYDKLKFKIIVGDCKGVDEIVRNHLSEYLPIDVYYAKWDKYGVYAGPKRNLQMINDSNYLIAFPMKNSKGTRNTINLASEHKVDFEVVELN